MKLKRFCFIILLSLIFISCSPAKTADRLTPSPISSLTSPISYTPIFIAIPTLTFTASPTLTLISTSTFPPTLTPLPTYSTVDDVIHAYEQLYTNNGGCELPCWWGITPGKTTLEEAKQFINRFAEFNSIEMVPSVENLYMWHSFAPGIDYAPSVEFTVTDGVVESIYIPSEIVGHQFPLQTFLRELGIPSKIFIGPTQLQSNDSEHTNITVYIIYEDLPILYTIRLYGATQNNLIHGNNNYLNPCQPFVSEELFIWDPGRYSYLDYLTFPGIKPLDQVSPMTVDGFYEKYKNPLSWNKICIDLTENIWK